MANAIDVEGVHYRYGDRVALAGVDLAVEPRQMFAILGPNGSGKSTLFKLLSTLAPLQEGELRVAGRSVRSEPNAVRSLLGVVFQYPSLDRKLTVRENIECQATLVGLRGAARRERVDEVLELLKLTDRGPERVETLSGGLKRRVELAKGILHRPPVLLLDEPSTGLDPAARLDYWAALQQLKNTFGTTVVMTTHLLEEADKADRIAIFHRGKVVAAGTPQSLRQAMGEAVLTVQGGSPEGVREAIREQLGWDGEIIGDAVRIRRHDAAARIGEITTLLGEGVDSVTLARPSLEDVFIASTGESFLASDAAETAAAEARAKEKSRGRGRKAPSRA